MGRMKKVYQEQQERELSKHPFENDRSYHDDRFRKEWDAWVDAIETETATDSGAEHANRK